MKKFSANDGAKIILIALVAQNILAIPLLLFKGDTRTYLGFFIPQLAYSATLFIYLKTKSASFSSTLFLKEKVRPVLFLFLIPITAGLFMQNLLISTSFSWMMQSFGTEMSVSIPAINSFKTVALSTLFLAVIPALSEEAVFRGSLLNSLQEKGELKAVMFSALIFALSHLNPAQLVHQFILGVFLSYITVKTKNLSFAVIIHFLNNITALFLDKLIPNISNILSPSANNALILLAITAVGALILYPSVFFLVKSINGKSFSWRNLLLSSSKGKNNCEMCYNIENQAALTKPTPSLWLIVLIATLSVLLIFNTIILSSPLGKELI